ncbi:MAG: glutamine synthetase [Candidatus Melainabacteria bacterium]|nr:glutamine synthetase [Candidatus Melainabacteria bacterium]
MTNTSTAQKVIETGSRYGVNLVRFLYTDLSGLVRGKASSLSTLPGRLESGIGLVKGMMAMNCLDKLQSDTGFGATGEIRLVPDLETFAVLPYVESSASFFCDMIQLDRSPWELCPRELLRRQVRDAAKLGYTVQAAFEPEFLISTRCEAGESREWKPIDTSVCFGTDGMNRADRFFATLVEYLKRQGVTVEQYYPELGHGQHEVSVAYAPAMQACDRYLLVRETLKGLALNQGLELTMAPKPFEEQPGNGCHLHLSLWNRDMTENVMFDQRGGLSRTALSFIAGIVKHLPALVSFTCPSANSFRRLKPKSWSSAYACWGYDNREAAVRVPSVYWGNEKNSTNIEIKCVDNTINPYLALSLVIACGIEGIMKEMSPPPDVSLDPADLSEEERQDLGIERLPTSLSRALIELETDIYLMKVLGEKLANTYIMVKSSEAAAFAHDVEFELAQHRLRY